MASNYPNALDNFTTNKTDATLTTVDHPTHHNDIADAVNKVEAELGVAPSGNFATLTARLDSMGGGTGATIPGFSPSNTGVQNTAALNAAITGLSGDGTLVIPRGDHSLDCVNPVFPANKSIKIVGEGPGSILRCSNENSTATLKMFQMSGTGRLDLENLRMIGPTTLGAGGRFDFVYADGTTGFMRAQQVLFEKMTSALRVSSSVNWLGNVEAYRCEFVGYGNTQGSTPILVNSQGTGARGRTVKLLFNRFSKFGRIGDGLNHALYVMTDWDLICAYNEFIDSVGSGYCVHLYDESVGVGNGGFNQIIHGNKFWGGLAATPMVIASQARPIISQNTIDTVNKQWIRFSGGSGKVFNNVFAGTNTTPFDPGIYSTATPNGSIEIFDNTFIGSMPRPITVSSPGTFHIGRNKFDMSVAPDYAVSIEATFSATRIIDNVFVGNYNSGVCRIAGGSSTMLVKDNYFGGMSTPPVVCDNAAASISVYNNEFNQAGQAIAAPTPPTIPIAQSGNFGSGLNAYTPIVQSASTITLPKNTNLVSITGTTTINSITPGYPGDRVTLKFNASIFLSDLNNIKIAGGFVADADDTITLICDGLNWFETGRAVN